MRILFFIEPLPLPAELFANAGWLTRELTLARTLGLGAGSSAELHLALPSRFLPWVDPDAHALFGANIHVIDEAPLVEDQRRRKNTLREAWVADFGREADRRPRKDLGNALPPVDFDVVLSVGDACRIDLGPETLHLAVDSSAFSRRPFRGSSVLDGGGLHGNSAPSVFAEVPVTPADRRLAELTRNLALEAIEKQQALRIDTGPGPAILLPLQASNYPSFDAQSSYGSQIDFLFDTCSRIDPRIAIVVTEHPFQHSLELHRGGGRRLEGLRQVFPNLHHLPRARFFNSASFQLLADVQGVWSVASKVAPVARYLGLEVGTQAGNHIAYAATAHTVEELCLRLLDADRTAEASVLPPPDIFTWMLAHYIVPEEMLSDPAWFWDYLQARLTLHRLHGHSPEAYPRLSTRPRDLVERHSQPRAVRAGIVQRKQALARDLEHTRTCGPKLNLKPQGDGPAAVLINDTARLERHRHLGCKAACATVERELARHGIRLAATVNSEAEAAALDLRPDLVVVNAEGSFHHNAPRASELLGVAEGMAAGGIPVAFVNALWEGNDPDLARRLDSFPIVATRDTASASALETARIPARCFPDLSFGTWAGAPMPDPSKQAAAPLVVTDSASFPTSVSLLEAAAMLDARRLMLLDDRKLNDFVLFGALQALNDSCVSTYWQDTGQIASARAILTGRFHVATACIAWGIPFAYAPSNSSKIPTLVADAGLDPAALDAGPYLAARDYLGLNRFIEDLVRDWPARHAPAATAYATTAPARIATLFDGIAALIA